MEPKQYIQRLNELSAKKLALIEEIHLYTRNQNEAIKASRFEDADHLLDERKSRMDAVDKLDEQFMVYSARLKSELSIKSLEELPRFELPGTAELKALVEKISAKLSDIKKLEEENNSLVRAELKDTKEKINHTNTFKRVSGAYHPVRNEVPSVYFDKKK